MLPCFSLSTELFASRVGGSDLFPQLFDDGQHLGILALGHLAVPSCLALVTQQLPVLRGLAILVGDGWTLPAALREVRGLCALKFAL